MKKLAHVEQRTYKPCSLGPHCDFSDEKHYEWQMIKASVGSKKYAEGFADGLIFAGASPLDIIVAEHYSFAKK